MTKGRLAKLAALAQGAALVGLGACSKTEAPVQAPSTAATPAAPDTTAVAASQASDASDGGLEAGGPVAGGWWRHHGAPNAMPPRLPRPDGSGDAGGSGGTPSSPPAKPAP